MSSIPSNLARVPNMLVSQAMLGQLNRTSNSLLQVQIQLATGRLVNRPSDNSVASSMITVLDDVIERREQRLRNLSHGEAMLNNIDAALADVNDQLIEVKGIALSQIGFGSDPEIRANQAKVIDAMIQNLISISNRQYQDMYFFGGKQTSEAPVQELLGGLRYSGQGGGMTTDFGLSKPVAITMSAEQAFGSLSSRIEGARDLNPGMSGNTRLVDLNGARGQGINLSTVNVNVGGTQLSVDLTQADTVQDVIDSLENAIQTVDPGATIDFITSGTSFQIAGNTLDISFSDPVGAAAAADLGLDLTFFAGGWPARNIDPRLTDLTPVSQISGVTMPMGTIRLTNAGQTRDVDLSGAQTVQDIRNAIEGAGLGIRVEIDKAGDRLNVINELSGGAMSIAEFGGGQTATELGIRSFAGTTRLSDFNDGRGIEIISGRVDAITGLPDPTKDLDLQISLKDGGSFDVDLAGAETVQDVMNTINIAAAAAGYGGAGPGDLFYIGLAQTGNGLELHDNTVGSDPFTVSSLNGSHAAEQLGILGSTSSAIMSGTDRATIATDSVFSHLIALRDALEADDSTGIEIAAGKLEGDILKVAQARADVGVRSRRVADTTLREEDLRIQDIALKSQVQDLDYTEAAIRFSTLQQQLQAGLISASQASSLTLLDFLR